MAAGEVKRSRHKGGTNKNGGRFSQPPLEWLSSVSAPTPATTVASTTAFRMPTSASTFMGSRHRMRLHLRRPRLHLWRRPLLHLGRRSRLLHLLRGRPRLLHLRRGSRLHLRSRSRLCLRSRPWRLLRHRPWLNLRGWPRRRLWRRAHLLLAGVLRTRLRRTHARLHRLYIRLSGTRRLDLRLPGPCLLLARTSLRTRSLKPWLSGSRLRLARTNLLLRRPLAYRHRPLHRPLHAMVGLDRPLRRRHRRTSPVRAVELLPVMFCLLPHLQLRVHRRKPWLASCRNLGRPRTHLKASPSSVIRNP